MTDDLRRTLVQPAADAARDKGAHRRIWVFSALMIAGITVLGLACVSLFARVDTLSSRADNYAEGMQALATQVRGMGGTPTVVPPERGEDGLPGKDGADGKDGQDGRDGATPPCMSQPSQCHGKDGADGKDGESGQPGVDGKPGKDGADGKDGQDGAPGAPGPACPEGYEPRPARITAPDGGTYDGVACVQPGSTQTPTTTPTARRGPPRR